MGSLKLRHHQTLDEVHRRVNEKLQVWGVTCSRRNVIYLFEAYCTLLKAAQQQPADPHFQTWVQGVRARGGLILSIDGIQPDKDDETIYLVREVVSGRVLNAENVTLSDDATIKRVLEPVLKLDLPILGVISDAQSSLREAIAELWPEIPHQTCQFHYLQEAARPIFEVDRGMRAKLRKTLTEKLRPIRPQIAQRVNKLEAETSPQAQQEQQQLEVLSGYALAVQASLHFDGKLPFAYQASYRYTGSSESGCHLLLELSSLHNPWGTFILLVLSSLRRRHSPSRSVTACPSPERPRARYAQHWSGRHDIHGLSIAQ